MRVSDNVACEGFPCGGMVHQAYQIPTVELEPERIRVLLISEAAPPSAEDGYYAEGEPLFAATTVQAFRDAGIAVANMQQILELGVYATTAIKCGKQGYGIKADPINTCSRLLERELALFPEVRVLLLMGDVAIKAVNAIARRAGEGRVIPAGSTYKLRGGEYWFRGLRAFPSYLQAGPAFYIEKSKRAMIAEDIVAAMALAR
ncbi:MAG: uracil-DNA glycosylase [Anaerolineae bacterium]|jgi:uracil-DNA glycosylase